MYQVGRPWMLLGKRFLPVTGMPILKNARSNTPLLVWLPEPLTVAMFSEKLFTVGLGDSLGNAHTASP